MIFNFLLKKLLHTQICKEICYNVQMVGEIRPLMAGAFIRL